MIGKIALVITICMVAFSTASAVEPITIESLLTEMIDRDSVACYPESDFRLKQHSSYNRASKTPDDPKGWFRNQDNNKHPSARNLIRIEENNGKKEWVLMDHQGPGAIVRSWMPWHNPKNASSEINMRIYLDGSDKPVLEGNMLSMFNGSGVIPYPFAHPSLRSAVNFFPIPYAKSCKVTTDQRPFFFIFTFREYDKGTPVKTFTMKDFKTAKGLTEKTGKMLLNPTATGADKPLGFSTTLGSRKEKNLELPAGVASVRELTVKLGSYEDRDVTRQVVLKMEFDGKETVWCPIGDFFGSGIGLNPVQGWYRTVAEDGTMSCRWVMPYQKSAKVSLLNLSGAPVDAELKVKTGAWTWDKRSMCFHAGWRGQYPVPTRPHFDWNYITLKGRGVYVGDTLTIMNPTKVWWGEGDEKIWVDGEDFPSMYGTGTEDYYGYSWGGQSNDFYEHPFHAQPRAYKYNKLNRKTAEGEGSTLGYSVETRSRSLDTMPFASSLKLDMEVWAWKDCDMGYGVGVYWYGDAATTSNRTSEPEEILNIPPLPDMTAKAPKKASATKGSFNNAVEAESMKVVSKTGNMVLLPQNLKRFKGNWNENDHLFFKGTQVGDAVKLSFSAQSPVAEKLVLHATKSYDLGMLRLMVNGKPAGKDIDLYASKPIPSGPIELGTFTPVDGAYILRAEVVGKNPWSKGHFFGLDCVTLSTAK